MISKIILMFKLSIRYSFNRNIKSISKISSKVISKKIKSKKICMIRLSIIILFLIRYYAHNFIVMECLNVSIGEMLMVLIMILL
jgi:hypothetical protein